MAEEAKGANRAKLQEVGGREVPLGIRQSSESDEIDILSALTCLLKTITETDKLSKLPLEQWLTYSSTQN